MVNNSHYIKNSFSANIQPRGPHYGKPENNPYPYKTQSPPGSNSYYCHCMYGTNSGNKSLSSCARYYLTILSLTENSAKSRLPLRE